MSNNNPVVARWINELKEKGYEPPVINGWSRFRIKYLSRTWRRILKECGLKRNSGMKALEFGVGGGEQLVPLYANGWNCVGIDCSEDVIERGTQYVKSVNTLFPDCGSIEFQTMDFLDFNQKNDLFDITFQFGVLEHFLNEDERKKYLRKMFDCTRPGGFIISCVPNGRHYYRTEQRSKNLGGYNIPEIDYSADLMKREFEQCGASAIKVLPLNLFGYLNIIPAPFPVNRLLSVIYVIFQFPLFEYLPFTFREKHAYLLAAIAQKPI
ncbi:class I SAM-dependent methyltransferase [Candidatus Latescibacterota bacterium]